MGTLKPHSNGPLYSNMVIGTLTVDGWYSEEGHGRAGALPSPLIAVPNVTVHPSTADGQCTDFILFDVALAYASAH